MPTSTLKVFYKGNALSIVQMGSAHHAVLSANGDRLGETTPLQTRLLAIDAQQSTVLSVSDSRTTLAYSPYGNDDCPTDTPVMSRFTGQPWLPSAVGYLLGNGHRLFNPVLMRFYSADSWSPFGKGGLNAYAYCSNDPINRSDPSGRYASFLKWVQGGYSYKKLSSKLKENNSSFSPNEYHALGRSLDKRFAKARRQLNSAVTQKNETDTRKINEWIATLDTEKLTYGQYTFTHLKKGPVGRYERNAPSALTSELLGDIPYRYNQNSAFVRQMLDESSAIDSPGIPEAWQYEDMRVRLERLRQG